MQKKKLVGILVILSTLFLLMGGSFYWFSYRPSEIRKQCHIESRQDEESKPSGIILPRRALKYEDCLKKNGMKSEDQVINLNINTPLTE